MTNEENTVNAESTPLREILKAAEQPLPTPAPGTEIDRLLATGERLLRSQQERLITEESKYQAARIAMADHYRVQMERLRQEAEDQLRALDNQHGANMTKIRSLITKLLALREA